MIAILPLRDRAALQKLNEAEHTNASHAYCLYDGGEDVYKRQVWRRA